MITRPAGTATALARRVRALGGVPLLLPGLALRGVDDSGAVQAGLREALRRDVLIFGSPAAVRFAARLAKLQAAKTVLAVGQATAGALRRHGIRAPLVPARQDSEGLLEHPALRQLRQRRVALIGAAGGRDLLREQLLARGARLRELHVYRRVPPRLDRRHFDRLMPLPATARVLLSSAQALQNLLYLLPAPALQRMRAAVAVVSSERLEAAAREAGFARVVRAGSALAADLLEAAARP